MKYNWIESMFPTTAVCSVEDIDFHGFTAKCFARPKEIKENYFGPVQYWKADGLYSERWEWRQ